MTWKPFMTTTTCTACPMHAASPIAYYRVWLPLQPHRSRGLRRRFRHAGGHARARSTGRRRGTSGGVTRYRAAGVTAAGATQTTSSYCTTTVRPVSTIICSRTARSSMSATVSPADSASATRATRVIPRCRTCISRSIARPTGAIHSRYPCDSRAQRVRSHARAAAHATRRPDMFGNDKKLAMPTRDEALPGRDQAMNVPDTHFVNGNPLEGPFPGHLQEAVFALGCFLGCRAPLLGDRGRFFDRGWLCRWTVSQARPTRKCAAVSRAIPKSCSSSTTRQSSATRNCSGFSGRHMTRPRACARATTSARSTARRSTRAMTLSNRLRDSHRPGLPGGTQRGRLW